MILALCTGTVSQAPTRRSTAKGNTFATFSVKGQAGDGNGFVSVAVFDQDVVPTALALAEGDAVSVTGRLDLRTWQGRDGQERTGISITATKLVVLTKPEPRRRKAASQSDRQPEPFGAEAGDLDGHLPEAGGGA